MGPNPTSSDGIRCLLAEPLLDRESADIRLNLMGPIAVAMYPPPPPPPPPYRLACSNAIWQPYLAGGLLNYSGR